MAKFNKPTASAPTAATALTPAPTFAHTHQATHATPGTTYEGARGFERDPKSELYLLALTDFNEDTFYESSAARAARRSHLAHDVLAEPANWEWYRTFVHFLRNDANMRTVSMVLAAEYAAFLTPGASWETAEHLPEIRAVINSALIRADEPGEFLAYYRSTFGHRLPMGVKRGLADACTRLYTENAVLRYDSKRAAYRFGDVIELVHPKPRDASQSALFKYCIEERHDRVGEVDAYLLTKIFANRVANRIDPPLRRAVFAGNQHENLLDIFPSWESLSGWLSDGIGMTKEVWQALIPTMGYMALLRNLRNFSQAGIGSGAQAMVMGRLTNPNEIAKSRQFPYRFYSAHKALLDAKVIEYGPALEAALNASFANLPSLPGRTLVLIDISSSMNDALSAKSKMRRWEVAALGALAVCSMAEHSDSFVFNADVREATFNRGQSILIGVDTIGRAVGGGTKTYSALKRTYQPHHDRIVIFTDEQAWAEVDGKYRMADEHYWGQGGQIMAHTDRDSEWVDELPIPIHTVNLGGYKTGAIDPMRPNRFSYGGFGDAALSAMPLLELGADSVADLVRAIRDVRILGVGEVG